MASRRRTPSELFNESRVGLQHWRSRIREAAYTSPSGARITFAYQDVSRSFVLRTTAFGFPGVPCEYIQQNSFGSRKYPLRCIFSGTYCDLEASAFERMLTEPGVGKLQHPLYGVFDVVPFGEVTRNDALKTAANQSTVDVVFWTTLRDIYPKALTDPENEISASLDRFNLAAAEQWKHLADVSGALEKAAAKATIRDFLRNVGGIFDQLSDTVWGVRDAFQDVQDTINIGIDQLIGKPLDLAQQIKNLLEAPSRAIDGIISRLDGYSDFADEIFGSASANPADRIADVSAAVSGRYGLTSRGKRIANDFFIADLFASQTMSNAVLSTLQSTTDAAATEPGASSASGRSVNAVGTTSSSDPRASRTFQSKASAIASADALMTLFDEYVTWRDAGFYALNDIDKTGVYQVDPGDAAAELRKSVALAAGNLVRISFTLTPERAVVLDRARTPIDLAGQLYGHVDPRNGFDPVLFLIETNALVGEQRLEIPKGKKILYYSAAA